MITLLCSVSYGRLPEVQKDLAVLTDVFTHDIMGELSLNKVDRQVYSTSFQGHSQCSMCPCTSEVTHDITLRKPYIS